MALVQLKEVVRPARNRIASVQSTIDLLTKYGDSRDLTVAVYLNQDVHFDPMQFRVPALNVAALWIFGVVWADEHRCGLWGSFLEEPSGREFLYPIR